MHTAGTNETHCAVNVLVVVRAHRAERTERHREGEKDRQQHGRASRSQRARSARKQQQQCNSMDPPTKTCGVFDSMGAAAAAYTLV